MLTIRLLLISLLLTSLATSLCAQEISVFAASSLTSALREISQTYEQQTPDTTILLNFAGSQTLAMQIEQGANADLFISANLQVMARLKNNHLVENPRPLLLNRLILAMRSDISKHEKKLTELARPNLLLAIGNQQVPIGRYTRQLFSNLATDPAYGAAFVARVEANIVSEENKVKAIVAKLLLGEVDAGVVYKSDLATSTTKQLTAIALPQKHNPQAHYPLAKVKHSGPAIDPFISFLYSPAAQQIFVRHGFTCAGVL